MQTISYTLSPLLIRTLENINILRREILLYPLSPKREMELRFDAMIDRIFSSLSLSGTPVKKEDIRKILSDYKLISGENNTVKNRKNLPVKQIVFYKHAFDFIREEWLVTPKTATFEDLIKLHNTASKGQLKIGKNRLEDVLTYLQTSSENAVVQAGIAKLQLTYLEPFSRGNDIVSTLAAYLFLYKAGLDFRGLLVMEKTWVNKHDEYIKNYQSGINRTHITGWLEYFAESLQALLLDVWENLKAPPASPADKSMELSDRQKKILRLLDEPSSVITNRQVQDLFGISQITASRDLAKMAGLGILFAHGKGRSVRYSKV